MESLSKKSVVIDLFDSNAFLNQFECIFHTKFTFECNLTAKFLITKIDTNTYHAETLCGLNIESPRGYQKDGSLAAGAKYIAKMTAFFIDNLKKTHKD